MRRLNRTKSGGRRARAAHQQALRRPPPPRGIDSMALASPERVSMQLGNTTPLVRGSPNHSGTKAWEPSRRRFDERASFGQRLSGVDQRTQRLMVMQKKIQLTEAMEKKLRLDTKNFGSSQGRPMMSELVAPEVDRMLSMDEFWTNAGESSQFGRSSPSKNGRMGGSLFDTDLLNASGRVSIEQVTRSLALALKAQELRSTGRIPAHGGGSAEVHALRKRAAMRASATLDQSRSLPDLRSPKGAAAPRKKSKSRRSRAKRSSDSNAGSGRYAQPCHLAPRQCLKKPAWFANLLTVRNLLCSGIMSNPMLDAQRDKQMKRAEVLIKRLVRDQMRELERCDFQPLSHPFSMRSGLFYPVQI